MRIILADDHKIVREGLRWMLSDEDDVEIVGEADSGRLYSRWSTGWTPTLFYWTFACPA